MKSFINFLLSGFGTGTNAGKAVGIVILICLSLLIAAFYIISFIWKMFQKNKKPERPA